MDTPIFDMILSRPLPSALIRLPLALRAETFASTPRRTMSWTDSSARYGLTTAAP